MSAPGRPKREYRSAQREGNLFRAPGRPKREYRSAQREGNLFRAPGRPKRECRSAQREGNLILPLALEALDAGGPAPATLNAANEVAVAAFPSGRIRFTDVAAVCAATLHRVSPRALTMLDDALAADGQARRLAGDWIAARAFAGTVTA